MRKIREVLLTCRDSSYHSPLENGLDLMRWPIPGQGHSPPWLPTSATRAARSHWLTVVGLVTAPPDRGPSSGPKAPAWSACSTG